MSNYKTNQTPHTISTVVIVVGILASQILPTQTVLSKEESNYKMLSADGPYRTKSAPRSFDQIRSIFGNVPDQEPDQFVESISNFYAALVASQEPLGSEFSRVLHENLGDLYER